MSDSGSGKVRRMGIETLAYGAAMAVDRALGLVLLPILTSAFSKEVYGAWSQILTAYALLSNFLLVGCYHSIMRYLPAKPDKEKSRVFHGMLVMIAVTCFLFVLVAGSVPRILSELLFAEEAYEAMVAAISIFVVSECFYEFVVVAFLRVERRILLCAVHQTLKNVLRVAILFYGATRHSALSELLIDLAIGNAAFVLAVYVMHVVPAIGIAIRGMGSGFWKEVAVFSLPIVATTTFGWANAFLNRFLIVHQLGLGDLGVFSVNYSIASIASLVSLATTFTLIPHLNAAWNQKDEDGTRHLLETGISHYLLASVPLAVATGVFYTPLRALLAPGDYGGSPLLIWSLAIFMLLYGLEQITTFATLLKNSHFSVYARAAALVVNVGVCLLLLRPIGIDAAGLAAMLALLVTISAGLRQIYGLVGFKFPWAVLLRLILPSIAMAFSGTALMWWLGTGAVAFVFSALLSVFCFAAVEMLFEGSLLRTQLNRCFWRSQCAE